MRKLLVGALAAAALVAAAPAGATTYTVFAGEQTRPPKGVPPFTSLNEFFPASIRIHRGDSIRFVSQSFHTATFLGHKTRDDLPLLVPDPGGATNASAPTDSAGLAFYWATLPRYVFGQAFGPVGSSIVTGGNVHSSGVIGPRGSTFTFPKTGTFVIHCLIHPTMEIPVVVKPAAAHIPGPGAVTGAANRLMARAFDAAKRLAKQHGLAATGNTVIVGPARQGPGGGETELFAFAPQALAVPVGTTVEFVAGSKAEIHNVTFGPPSWWTKFDRKASAPNGSNVDPVWIYGTDEAPTPVPPTTTGRLLGRILGAVPFTYDGSGHGNGAFATGIVSQTSGLLGPELPQSVSITFTKAGTYHYFCLIHGPQMSGDIVVTPAP